MKVLVIGSGGREHALVWKISQSPLADKIFCAPGNAGIAQIATCVDIRAEAVAELLAFAKKERIDLTVVGPEAALACGIVDEFRKNNLAVFGPDASAARLESSKVFAKQLMAKYGIPTAAFKVFNHETEALEYLDTVQFPCVVKADGLAAGKGVVIAQSKKEATDALIAMMHTRVFGDAGATVIIEDCLAGEEASFLAVVDSGYALPLASSQDHKRVFDGDRGPNTGGMGAYSPAPVVTRALEKQIRETIIEKTIFALRQEHIEYRGILYAGIMITKSGPMVLEFNVRFGDPETQSILPRLKTDLLELMFKTSEGRLSTIQQLSWDTRACVCVVCASQGYPGPYAKNKPITGLDEAARVKDIAVFHAGTRLEAIAGAQAADEKKRIVTNGGRVLGVTGLGDSIQEAIEKTYRAVGMITFEGMHYRRDIGSRALDDREDK
ncbi:MAG: phosphoribosylamine--glycine ligase [Candidatus Omnitrophota bacterium]